MLVAKKEDGTLFSLADQFERSELQSLKERESFYCPACHSTVELRLGYKRRWHFSHRKGRSCAYESEAESNYHLQGKKLLYQWLLSRNKRAELEPFLPHIKQRPDLLFHLPSRPMALEFQCSTISPELLLKRTTAFQQSGISPIWILGGNRLKRLGQCTFQLSQMDWLTLRKGKERHATLSCLYFCPDVKKFAVLTDIFPYGTSKVFARIKFYPFFSFPLHSLIHSSAEFQGSLPEHWLKIKQNWRMQSNHYRGRPYKYVQKLYGSLSLIPAAAGWPTFHHYVIETPCFLWQSWLFHKYISAWPPGKPILFHQVAGEFRSMVSKGIFQVRRFPLVANVNEETALQEYLQCLVQLGYLRIAGKGCFRKEPDFDRMAYVDDLHHYDIKYFEKLSSFI